MITVKHGEIRWESEDVRIMSKILGPEHAIIGIGHSYGRAPLVPSILKLAKKKGLILKASAERALDTAINVRERIDVMRKMKDAAISDPQSDRYFRHQRSDLHLMYMMKWSGWLIASEAGVGKTLVAIRYAEYLKAKRILLIVPNAAKEQWADAIHVWGSQRLPIHIVQGTVPQQEDIINNTDRGWCIGHWESLVYAQRAWIKGSWDVAILDEAQNIQNRHAQRTGTVHKIKATTRIAITAHPYANGVSEIFPILKFLYPNLYPGFWRWANMHVEITPGVFGGIDLRTPRRPNLLNWEIAPFTIRHLWKDVWENLPPITRIQRTAELPLHGAREYKKLRKQFFVELETHEGKDILAIPSMLARVTRLRQYLVDPGILNAKQPSVKYPIVYDLIKELAGRPPVIFTMWRESALRLQAYLGKKKVKTAVVVGGMSSSEINRIKKRFLDGKYDAVIIMIKVGGTALNFGKYGTIVYLDHPWNQRDVEQTEGRVRRPEEHTGRVVPATSYHIVVRGSYEERMKEQRYQKHQDFSKVFTVALANEELNED